MARGVPVRLAALFPPFADGFAPALFTPSFLAALFPAFFVAVAPVAVPVPVTTLLHGHRRREAGK